MLPQSNAFGRLAHIATAAQSTQCDPGRTARRTLGWKSRKEIPFKLLVTDCPKPILVRLVQSRRAHQVLFTRHSNPPTYCSVCVLSCATSLAVRCDGAVPKRRVT